MNTQFDFQISCRTTETRRVTTLLSEIRVELRKLESEISAFQTTSEVSRLNRGDGPAHVAKGSPTEFLLKRSLELFFRTQGAFDCTGRSRLRHRLPTGRLISFDVKTGAYIRHHPEVAIDFGAIGKGFAIDKAAERLDHEGFHDYCLSAGGSSLLLSGFYGPRQPWTWGWSFGVKEGNAPVGFSFEHHTGKRISLGISGREEQGDHIYREDLTQDRPCSALVAGKSAWETDALSTALYAKGWKNSQSFLNDDSGPFAAATIDCDLVPHWNRSFQSLWSGLSIFLFILSSVTASAAEEAIDLSIGTPNFFNPYPVERNSWWILLPVSALLLVVAHLRKLRRKRTLSPMERP